MRRRRDTAFTTIRGAETMSRALRATNQKYFPNENIPVHLLSQFVISPGELYSQTTTPITAIGDLANCKIWVLPGPLAAISRNLGSGMVSTPGLEIQGDHLSRGS